MLRSLAILLTLLPAVAAAPQADGFDDAFRPGTLRLDYYHGGTATEEFFILDAVREEPGWAGPETGLVSPFDQGRYVVRVEDAASRRLLFSRGYATVFGEWQTVAEAKARRRVFRESISAPFPRRPVAVSIHVRDRTNRLREACRWQIDPGDGSVRRDPPPRDLERIVVERHGPPARKVDLVVVAEGYRADQMDRFEADARRLLETFFTVAPFAERRTDFNVTLLCTPSADEGIDEPACGRFRRTAAEASFDAFGLPRYVLVEDHVRLRDLVAGVPFDALVVLVNSAQYGGGGIYNWLVTVTARHPWSPYVLVHEFGHAFAGLADEYYSSAVTYEDFYPVGVEPAAPNITRLAGGADRARLKWGDLVAETTPLPTPWPQARYDALVAADRKQVAAAREAGRTEEEVHALEVHLDAGRRAWLAGLEWHGKVGAFEGGGYVAKGVYRPGLDCIMFSKGLGEFCPVCRRALGRVIDHGVGR
ncbi:MAG: peptidase M64 [Planctomycetes bacterium]|nr:peptidase M64 [Planctomycetota bacterium]